MAIFFHSEQIKFTVENKNTLKKWIQEVVETRNCKISELNFIFTSDNKLLEINKKYLSHNYYTDVITFDYSEESNVSGDIYISIDTIKKNAKKYKVNFLNELYRIIIHGVLHLLGFDDKNDASKKIMKNYEDYSLDLLRKEIEF